MSVVTVAPTSSSLSHLGGCCDSKELECAGLPCPPTPATLYTDNSLSRTLWWVLLTQTDSSRSKWWGKDGSSPTPRGPCPIPGPTRQFTEGWSLSHYQNSPIFYPLPVTGPLGPHTCSTHCSVFCFSPSPSPLGSGVSNSFSPGATSALRLPSKGQM